MSLTTGFEEETGPMCFPEIPLPRNRKAMLTNYISSCLLSLTVLDLPMQETSKVLKQFAVERMERIPSYLPDWCGGDPVV